MKKQIPVLVLALVVILSGSLSAQRARINTEAVTPHKLSTLGITTNSVSTGLDVVANETYVYLSPQNIGNSDQIASAVFEFVSKPASSTATIETVQENWAQFKVDVKGAYVVKLTITTGNGSHDTTKTIYSSDFVGVGNFEGIAASYPNCMTCHQHSSKFQAIFEKWQGSAHANTFKDMIDFGSTHFNESCFKCHTTGTDKFLPASNNGFDDVASQLGWDWGNYTPATPGNWDSLRTNFPSLVNHATIGCESCHGAGSEHTMGADPKKIQVSLDAGNCGQCHDSPWRYNEYVQWEESGHGNAVWSGSFAQGTSSQNNSLSNCIRCHDGQGFVNFTNDNTTNTTGMVQANHQMISCATCHDPHGNDQPYSVRFSSANSDTLGNGFSYSVSGTANLCMDCHKARTSSETYILAPITQRWGPHHSVQTDNYLGENAATFDGQTPFLSSPHKFAVGNGCVTCHMSATTDTGTVNRDKVGGHTFALHNEETDYYHTTSCTNCHGQKSSWEDFTAKFDYDGNGSTESIPAEITGLEKNLRVALPPFGIDSISWQMIRDTNDVNITKAYFNYQLIAYDGSKGMHNAMFAIDVLRKSTAAIGGFVTSVETLDDQVQSDGYVLVQNYPNPFNPSTTINFNLPFESKVRIKVFDIKGELVKELANGIFAAGVHAARFNTNETGSNLSSGVYIYTIEAVSLNGDKSFKHSKKMVLLK